jgi:hypothetical protein
MTTVDEARKNSVHKSKRDKSLEVVLARNIINAEIIIVKYFNRGRQLVFLYTDRHCGWWYQRVTEPSRFSS